MANLGENKQILFQMGGYVVEITHREEDKKRG
jgi:hypothetical protein